MPNAALATLYLVTSALAFAAHGIDKAAARNGFWRIPEPCLHLLGLAGGWPGALLAMHLFRHKTRKSAFLIGFWFTTVLNVLLTGLLHMRMP